MAETPAQLNARLARELAERNATGETGPERTERMAKEAEEAAKPAPVYSKEHGDFNLLVEQLRQRVSAMQLRPEDMTKFHDLCDKLKEQSGYHDHA